MKKTDWKGTAELIGIAAIVVSLVLVAFELRQNTNAVRATAVQEATNVARGQILMFAQDPDMARISLATHSELSKLDQRRAFWVNRSFWVGMQGLYRQHVLGVFPEEEWQFWAKVICSNYLEDKVDEAQFWPGNAASLAADFVRFVENCSSLVPGVVPD